MKKSMKKVTAMTMAAMMAALLGGCGSSASETTAAATTAKAEETTAAASEAAADTTAASGDVSADVQKIVDRGEDDLAYNIAGEIFGCTPEEAKDKKLVEFQGVTAKTRGPLLENGEIDLVIATFTITDERKETYNFSTPYYTDAVGLLVNNDSGIESIEDLDGKIIGVAQSSTTKDGFKAYVEEKGLNVNPEFQEFDGYPALAQALATKQIDCFSVDRAILSGYVNDSNHILDDRFSEQEYGVASAKENTGLAELVDEKVTSMISDGSMKTLQEQWNLQ